MFEAIRAWKPPLLLPPWRLLKVTTNVRCCASRHRPIKDRHFFLFGYRVKKNLQPEPGFVALASARDGSARMASKADIDVHQPDVRFTSTSRRFAGDALRSEVGAKADLGPNAQSDVRDP
jgi:hypothetical protein